MFHIKRQTNMNLYTILILTKLIHLSDLKCLHSPLSIKRYDQADLLQEDEERREILKDYKTIYAPENRIYTNDTLCSTVTVDKKKRGFETCREDDIYKEYDPRRDFFSKSSKKGFYEDRLMYGKKMSSPQVLKDMQIDLDLIDKKINGSRVKDSYKGSAMDDSRYTVSTNSLKDSLNIKSLWHNTLNTNQIRKIQSKIMQKYMNKNVDPCLDFYEYACGNWKNYYTIPPDRATYDIFEMVRENLDQVLNTLLAERRSEPPTKVPYFKSHSFIDKNFLPHDTSDAVAKAKLFYASCMDENAINKRADEPLRGLLRELGDWPILVPNWRKPDFDVIWLLARLRMLNNDILIAQWVGPDMKNSNEYIVHIDQTTLGLPTREYYLEDFNMKYLQAYRVFILAVAEIMGADVKLAENDVDEIIRFEISLAKIMASPEERRNISETYLRTDIASLTLYFPQFDWKSYFDVVLGTDINLRTPVACYCTKFLTQLLYILSITPPKLIQNYILWRFVRHRTSNLDRRFLEAKQRFYHILFGREKSPPRWQFCVTQVNSNMGMALGSLFVQKYFDKKSKTDTIEMTKQLEEAFKKTIEETGWLDNNTKEYAIMKLSYMDLKIGFPDFILNQNQLNMRYYDVEVHPKYFFENVMTFLRHLTKVEQRRLGTTVNRTQWSTPPAIVNAYYSRNKNQIMFPAGILQPPFYNRHFPKALNFGGIGVVIGHEITHGFDDKGRLFDHKGNLHMWWRETSIQKFYEKSQCMIDQYGQYVLPEINLALDGFMTQGENIADNGGLKQAFRTYETWLKNNPGADETLPDLDLTSKQLFFLNFAQVWCGQQRVEAAKSRIKISVHAPGIFRVIGVLSNSEEFSREFNCSKNSPMNPEFKCIIW